MSAGIEWGDPPQAPPGHQVPRGRPALEEFGPLTPTAGRRDYLAFLVLGLTGLVGNTTLWFWGLKHTTALNAGIIGASSPLFVAVAAAVLLGRQQRRSLVVSCR